MPQLDSVTFAPIIFYVFIIYVGGYLVFNLTVFVTLFDKLKSTLTAFNSAYKKTQVVKKLTSNILNFPLISL